MRSSRLQKKTNRSGLRATEYKMLKELLEKAKKFIDSLNIPKMPKLSKLPLAKAPRKKRK